MSNINKKQRFIYFMYKLSLFMTKLILYSILLNLSNEDKSNNNESWNSILYLLNFLINKI